MPVGNIPPLRGKPFQYPTLRVVNPGKGLNNLVSDSQIDDREASDLSNIFFTEGGAPTKSPGKSDWGSGLSNNPRGLGTFVISGGGSRYVVTIDGTALKYTTASTDTWTTVSGATFDSSHDVTFTQLRDKLFIWDGVSGGAIWDGTTLSRPGTMPSAQFSIYYSGYHIAAGTTTKSSRLYVAAASTDSSDGSEFIRASAAAAYPPVPNNATDVPGTTAFGHNTSLAAQIIDINPADGDKITGLARFNSVLIIFKEKSIYQLSFDGSGNPTVTPVINYLGAVSHKSIDNVENEVFYLSRLGWFILGYQQNFYNVIRSNELSARIHPVIETLNPAQLSRVASIYKPYVYYSSYPTGSTNNNCLVYDKRYDAWSKVSTIHANYFTVFVDTSNVEHLLFASDDETKVYEITASTYSDSGSAITSYFTTKAFDAKIPDVYKRWIDVTLLFRQLSGTVSVTIYADNGVTVHSSSIAASNPLGGIGMDQFGAAQFGDSPNTAAASTSLTTSTSNVPYRIRVNTKSRTLKIKVQNANLNENFILQAIFLTYRPYSHFTYPSALKIQ